MFGFHLIWHSWNGAEAAGAFSDINQEVERRFAEMCLDAILTRKAMKDTNGPHKEDPSGTVDKFYSKGRDKFQS